MLPVLLVGRLPRGWRRVRARTVAGALAACGVSACGLSRPPAGIPASPAPPPVAPPTVSAPVRWSISAPRDTANFVIAARAVLAIRADSLAQSDTLTTQTTLRAIPRGAALDVTVTSYSVRAGRSAPRVSEAPLRAVGRFNPTGGIVFEGAGSASCTNIAAAALEATRDLWVRWPAEVRVGDQWRDSVSVGVCRDGVPLSLSLVRDYRVAAVAGDSAEAIVSIARRSQLRVSGRGTIRGDSTVFTGEGSGTGTLRVAVATGWVLDGSAETSLQLRARDARRTQVVAQSVQLTFRRTP